MLHFRKMSLSEVRSRAQRAAKLVKRPFGEKRRPSSPVSSMRSFWGLLFAYWLSKRWKEAWILTFLILLLTGLSAQASVWFALTSGELVNQIANFHHPTVPTTPLSLLKTAATLAAIAITRDAGFTAVRHFLSTSLHRKWRQWLDERFNRALLDSNHTHFHLQQNGFGGGSEADASSAPDNIDQRVQEAIKGMTGGAIGLGVGIAGVVLSLAFVGGKLIETSSPVRGLDFLGSYGSACLTLLAIAIYVPLNTFIAAKLGGILQGLSIRIQSAEGSYRSELNQLLHRSFHVAVIKGEPAQKALNVRRYRDIDRTWASLNRITAGYMGFELVHNFLGSRIVAYAPGLLPYVDKTISLQDYVTGAELATALINECSWFIHAMPDIATLRADAHRITELAEAIETVQRPQDYYAQSGPAAFEYTSEKGAKGLTIHAVELMHTGEDEPFLSANALNFAPGEWTLVMGESGSGKTSLLKAINGLWPHGKGKIALPDGLQTLYAAQDVKLQGVCLKDLVCLPDEAGAHQDTAVSSALKEAGLEEFQGELRDEGRDGQQWDKLLSGGEKQKLVLAKILLLKPGLLFLDEATSALDGQAVQAFFQSIKDNCPDATVIAIMHDTSSIQSEGGIDFFDSVLVIGEGAAEKVAFSAWQSAQTSAQTGVATRK